MADSWSVEVVGETDFLLLQSPGMQVLEGDLGIRFGAVLEKLRTPGVNSYRHRERSREFPDLRLQLNEDTDVTRDIYNIESRYRLAEGILVTLTVSILDVRVRWKHVTVDAVQITARDGPLFGRGANVDSKHTIWSAWTFARQDEGEILE